MFLFESVYFRNVNRRNSTDYKKKTPEVDLKNSKENRTYTIEMKKSNSKFLTT